MDLLQSELRIAQLTALQNQITPHYLVNSLDAIRMKLILDGQDETAELLRCLQNSLRTYGFSPDQKVPLWQEFVFLEDTLKFHAFRFLGSLTWEMSFPPELRDMEIPRFLLQPIVENSLRHGLTPDLANPHLQVRAVLQDHVLLISVSDNGKGFLDSGNAKGIGLANVQQRLKLLYGDSSDLQVKSDPGFGTCVTLCLPEKGGGDL